MIIPLTIHFDHTGFLPSRSQPCVFILGFDLTHVDTTYPLSWECTTAWLSVAVDRRELRIHNIRSILYSRTMLEAKDWLKTCGYPTTVTMSDAEITVLWMGIYNLIKTIKK